MALTDTAIRQSKPGKKPYKIYDRDGLFLLVNPGGSKLWRCSRFNNKLRLPPIRSPTVTIPQDLTQTRS